MTNRSLAAQIRKVLMNSWCIRMWATGQLSKRTGWKKLMVRFWAETCRAKAIKAHQAPPRSKIPYLTNTLLRRNLSGSNPSTQAVLMLNSILREHQPWHPKKIKLLLFRFIRNLWMSRSSKTVLGTILATKLCSSRKDCPFRLLKLAKQDIRTAKCRVFMIRLAGPRSHRRRASRAWRKANSLEWRMMAWCRSLRMHDFLAWISITFIAYRPWLSDRIRIRVCCRNLKSPRSTNRNNR